MMRRVTAFVLSIALLCGVIVAVGGVLGAFKATTANPNNNFTAAADWVAPSASRSVVGKSQGGIPGFIRQGGTFFVYAQVADTGNPASGVSSVTATAPQFPLVSLASGSFSTGGLSYNWRNSTPQSLTGTATPGTYTYQLNSTDTAGNARSQNFTVVVDNTAPTATNISTANVGSIAGRPQQNDTITFTFSEQIEPISVLAGWGGAGQNVVVRVNHAATDQVQIFNAANTAQLPLGTVNLGGTDYVTANTTFGATGTASRMTQSGSSITVVLGTESAAATTQATNTTMTWPPSATATDRAGNPASTATLTEPGTADREF